MLVCALGLALLDGGDRTAEQKFAEGLWNGVNLLSTLGDFTAFNPAQKRYMVVMVMIAVLVGGVAITNMTGLLSSEDVMIYRENRAMTKALSSLKDHVIVVGFDAVGQLVADRLREGGDTVVVVTAVDAFATLATSRKFYTVSGNVGTDDSVLTAARVDTARALVVATNDPDKNLVITLSGPRRQPAARHRRLWRKRQPQGPARKGRRHHRHHRRRDHRQGAGPPPAWPRRSAGRRLGLDPAVIAAAAGTGAALDQQRQDLAARARSRHRCR